MIQELQEKIRQTGLIPLSEETLPFIKVGMYWYEGDEFSENLIAGKPIKSVVLLVNGKAIYGDVFVEERVSQDELVPLIQKVEENKDGQEKLIIPSVMLLSEIASSISVVNEILPALGKDVWEGTYLTSSDYACFRFWTISFPGGVRGSIGKGSVCNVRKVCERYVI